MNSSLNFKTPYHTLFIPGYKNLGLEREDKMVCEGMNPPSSQIAGHLNKGPIKIQPLSLLIGFGSDGQPQHRCLFRFPILATPPGQTLGLSGKSGYLAGSPVGCLD